MTSLGVKKTPPTPLTIINHLTCWNNPPVVGTWKSPTFERFGDDWISPPRSSWFLCPPCCGRSLWDPFSRCSTLMRYGAGETLKRFGGFGGRWWEYQGVLDTQKRDHRYIYIIHMYRSICYMYVCIWSNSYGECGRSFKTATSFLFPGFVRGVRGIGRQNSHSYVRCSSAEVQYSDPHSRLHFAGELCERLCGKNHDIMSWRQ